MILFYVPDLRFAAGPIHLDLIKDITVFHKQGYYTTEKYNTNSNYYLFSGSNFINHTLNYESCNKINVSKKDFEAFKIKKGDILLVRSGSVGDYAVVDSDVNNAIFGSYLIKFNIDNSKVMNQYFCYFYESQAFKKQLKKITQASANTNINADNIKSVLIHYPDLLEQQIIVDFLSLIDKKIVTQKKIISSLESQIKAIKCNLFNSTIGTKKALTDVLDEISIKSTINNQYPVVSSTVKGLVLQSEYFDKEIASADNTGYKIIARDNIIISPQNLWMGNITFNDKFDNGIVSPSYKIFNVKDDYNKLYIFELMTTNKAFYLYKTVSEQGASVVRRNLNTEAFMQLIFNVPSRETQDKIINNLYCFKNKLENEKKILSLCEKQKQYLLDKLFI